MNGLGVNLHCRFVYGMRIRGRAGIGATKLTSCTGNMVASGSVPTVLSLNTRCRVLPRLHIVTN